MHDFPFSNFILANENLLMVLGGVSIITFISSLLIVPWLIVRIPEDYFAFENRPVSPWSHRHTVIRWLGLIGKNLLGLVLVVMGLAMLVLPGQGLLTIFIGTVLLNFPGKYHLERRLVRMGPVWNSINWLRRRAGHSELVMRD
ncbi:MAG: PGPGW domain-containing protein [Gammaproteobacteria bacterium]